MHLNLSRLLHGGAALLPEHQFIHVSFKRGDCTQQEVSQYHGIAARADQSPCAGVQLNKLINHQVLPYATGDEEDRIRELTQDTKVQAVFFHQRQGLKKFFTKRYT
jgi:hypothetical protein